MRLRYRIGLTSLIHTSLYQCVRPCCRWMLISYIVSSGKLTTTVTGPVSGAHWYCTLKCSCPAGMCDTRTRHMQLAMSVDVVICEASVVQYIHTHIHMYMYCILGLLQWWHSKLVPVC